MIDGSDAAEGAWPWVVALEEGEEVFCTGVLLRRDVVLTAGHCVSGREDLTSIEVLAGSVRVDEADRRGVLRAVVHEEFDTRSLENDVALLYLASPFSDVPVVALPGAGGSGEPLVRGVVLGFGATGRSVPPAPVLQELEVSVLSDGECIDALADRRVPFDGDDAVCANGSNGGDVCPGDSGGPLLAPNPGVPDDWSLVGLVSHGADCAATSAPAVFTDVRRHVAWLSEHLPGSGGPNRFETPRDESARIPASASVGKASRYPWTLRVPSDAGRVDVLEVELFGLSHSRSSDLDVWLAAPDGTIVTLFSDAAVALPASELVVRGSDGVGPPPVGVVTPVDHDVDPQWRRRLRPPADLSVLLGVPAGGDWRLYVADDSEGAAGQLQGWALTFRSQ